MEQLTSFFLVLAVVLIRFPCEVHSGMVKFTNLKCESFDESFVTFKKCNLKAVARDKVSLHVHAELHQLPVDNCVANSQLFSKGNGYRPLLYNSTYDHCDFVKHLNRHMFWKIVYNIIQPYTNVNHTCPYNHDIIVDGIILDANMFKLIPFPSGDYMVQLQYAVHNVYRAKLNVYIKTCEKYYC